MSTVEELICEVALDPGSGPPLRGLLIAICDMWKEHYAPPILAEIERQARVWASPTEEFISPIYRRKIALTRASRLFFLQYVWGIATHQPRGFHLESSKDLPIGALGKVARWLRGEHPCYSVELSDEAIQHNRERRTKDTVFLLSLWSDQWARK